MRLQKYIEPVNESSLSRVYNQMKLHDSGTITAFRYARDCGTGEKYTHDENLKRNRSLQAKLQDKRYSVTRVKGSYIENYGTVDSIEVGETVFLVVDINDRGHLKTDLMELGELFDQDSIMFIPKGGVDGHLIGTNHCVNGFPGYHINKPYSHPIFGVTGVFLTRVKGRPFTLTEDVSYIPLPEGFFGRWGCNCASKMRWEDL